MEASARVDGLDEALRALRRMDKEGQAELRAEVQKMAGRHAEALAAVGRAHPDPRVRHVASTVRAKKDRLPTILVGSAKRAPIRGRARAVDLVYGTEFGAGQSSWWRFPRTQAWIFPTLSARHRQVVREWEDVVDRVARKWAK